MNYCSFTVDFLYLDILYVLFLNRFKDVPDIEVVYFVSTAFLGDDLFKGLVKRNPTMSYLPLRLTCSSQTFEFRLG